MKGLVCALVGAAVLSAELQATADEPAGPSAAPAPAPAPAPARWYDAIQLGAFIDAYASLNANQPEPQTPTAGIGGNQFRAFDVTNGFALSWAGVDASYPAEPVGGTLSLRLGPTAEIYAGNDARYGLEYVKQAFASWKPGGASSRLRFDFGKFDSPYGAEVAESQLDIQYSRSLLFTYAEPLFFTGLALDWGATDTFDVRIFAANGWDNSVALSESGTVGAQLGVKLGDSTVVTAGYVVGPQQSDATVVTCLPGQTLDAATLACQSSPGAVGGASLVTRPDATSNLRHMADVVLDATVTGALRFVLSADFDAEQLGGSGAPSRVATWYGANLSVRYAFSSVFSVALRGEYLADPQGWATQTLDRGTALAGGTLTVGYSPTPNLVLKLEERVDYATTDAGAYLFQKGSGARADDQATTVVGVVVRTN